MSSWPGTQPVTPRELQQANRRVLASMRKRDTAKKRLVACERDLREARRDLSSLLDRVTGVPPTGDTRPTCSACGAKLGDTPVCLECQGAGLVEAP
jgi:hypothetical protein